MLALFNLICRLFLCFSPSSKSGLSKAETDRGSSMSEPSAAECDRHVYKSILEGGDIPLQGLRALNKRHGSSSSSKGKMCCWKDTWAGVCRVVQSVPLCCFVQSFFAHSINQSPHTSPAPSAAFDLMSWIFTFRCGKAVERLAKFSKSFS